MATRVVTLEPARRIEADAAQVMAWRNDPDTLAASFHREPKVWERFWPEFQADYFALDVPAPVFAWEAGRRIGFVRFGRAADPEGARRCVDISINIAPDARAAGRGRAVLEAVEPYLRAAQIDVIYAEIRVENPASQRSFEAVGYRRIGEAVKTVEDTGEKAGIFRYLRELS